MRGPGKSGGCRAWKEWWLQEKQKIEAGYSYYSTHTDTDTHTHTITLLHTDTHIDYAGRSPAEVGGSGHGKE